MSLPDGPKIKRIRKCHLARLLVPNMGTWQQLAFCDRDTHGRTSPSNASGHGAEVPVPIDPYDVPNENELSEPSWIQLPLCGGSDCFDDLMTQ
jgi:hypothetical protein